MTLFKFGVLNPFVPRECFVSNDIVQIGVLNPFLRVCVSELAGYLHVAKEHAACQRFAHCKELLTRIWSLFHIFLWFDSY